MRQGSTETVGDYTFPYGEGTETSVFAKYN
jgi:hypothetical protein